MQISKEEIRKFMYLEANTNLPFTGDCQQQQQQKAGKNMSLHQSFKFSVSLTFKYNVHDCFSHEAEIPGNEMQVSGPNLLTTGRLVW